MPATVKIVFKGVAQTTEAKDKAKADIEEVAASAESGGVAMGVFFGEMAANLMEVALSEGWNLIKEGIKDIVDTGMESNSQFEIFTNKFITQFKGNVDEAKAKMEELQQVGFTNPEQLADIDKMDIKLVAVGMDSETTAAKFGMSGAQIRQDILNTATGIATSTGDMATKLDIVTNNITKFSQAAGSGSTQAVNAIIRMGAVTREELQAAGLQWNAHNSIIGDKVNNTKIILNTLGAKYKGLDKLSMTSLSGIESNFEDLKQYIGREITSSMFADFKQGLLDLEKVLGSDEAKIAYKEMSESIGRIIDAFGKMFGTVSDNSGAMIGAINGIAAGLNWLADAATAMSEITGNVFTNLLEPLVSLAENAFTYGSNLVISFANGMSQAIGAVGDALGGIGSTITGLLEAHSPPKLLPDLDKWGLSASKAYFSSWADPEVFKVFDTIKATVSQSINDLVSTGAMDQKGAIPAILGTDADVAKALTEFNQLGAVSQATFDKIKADAGSAGGAIVDMIKANLDVATAMKTVAADQKTIKDLTDQYDAQLTPLKDHLKDIGEQQKTNAQTTKDALEPYQDDLNKLGNQLSDIRQKTQDAITPWQDNVDSLNAQIDTLKNTTLDALGPWEDKLEAVKSQLDDIKTKTEDAIAPLQDQNQAIDNELKLLGIKKQIADQQDIINGTGKHEFDLAKAQNTVADDAVKAKLQELNYTKEHETIVAAINGGKLKGAALDAEKIKLQELDLKHEQEIRDLKLKTAEDQDKLNDIGSGANQDKAKLELQKLQNTEKIEAAKQAAKVDEDALKAQAKGMEKQIKDIKETEKEKLHSLEEEKRAEETKIKGAKEQERKDENPLKKQENADKEAIKAIQDQAKTRDDLLKKDQDATQRKVDALEKEKKAHLDAAKDMLEADKAKLKTADDHLKVLQAQTKELHEQLGLADKQEKLMDSLEKKATAALKGHGGGKIGGGGVKKEEGNGYTSTTSGSADGGHGGGEQGSVTGSSEAAGAIQKGKNFEHEKEVKAMKDKIVGIFNDLKAQVMPIITDIEGKIKAGFDTEIKPAITSVTGLIKDLTNAFNTIMAPINTAQHGWQSLTPPINSTEAALRAARIEFTSVSEKAEKLISGAFAPMMPHLISIGGKFEHLAEVIGPKLQPLLDQLVRYAGIVIPIALGEAAIAITPVIGFINGLLGAIDNALPQAETTLSGFVTTVTDYFKLISDTFSNLGILADDILHLRMGKIWGDLGNLISTACTDIGVVIKDTGMNIANIFLLYFDLVTGYAKGFYDGVVGWFSALYDTLVGHSIVPDLMNAIDRLFLEMVVKVTKTIAGWVEDAKKTFQGFSDSIIGAAGIITVIANSVAGKAEAIGSGIVAGIRAGIQTAWNEFVTFWNNKVDAIPAGMGAKLEIHSPSRVMADMAQWIPKGMAQGIEDNMHLVHSAMGKMTDVGNLTGPNGGRRGSQAEIDELMKNLTPDQEHLKVLQDQTKEMMEQEKLRITQKRDLEERNRLQERGLRANAQSINGGQDTGGTVINFNQYITISGTNITPGQIREAASQGASDGGDSLRQSIMMRRGG